jgi:hypothetical protein
MCDVSKGGWGGGVLQRNEHMTFLMDKIDMRGFPYVKRVSQRFTESRGFSL